MNGKIVGVVLILSGLVAGIALYYLQIYGFYEEVPADPEGLTLMSAETGQPEVIPVSDYRAIDADSSPIRYRACFSTDLAPETLTDTYVTLDAIKPRNAPGWFDCFDAPAIAAELEAGTALPFLSRKNIDYGVDRVVAITGDGRGYVWHELNDCGEKSYDGTVVGEECPPRPTE